MPDYFVFVAWACRLLLDWSLCQRQRQRSRSGFKRLRRFGRSPCRPVVPSTHTDSTKIASAASDECCLTANIDPQLYPANGMRIYSLRLFDIAASSAVHTILGATAFYTDPTLRLGAV